VRIYVPEPARAPERRDAASSFRHVLRSRDLWLLGVTGVMPVYVQYVMATWGPLLFAEVGVADLGRSALLASLQGLPAPVALLISGGLADRARRRGVHPKIVIVGALAGAIVTVAAMAAVVQARGPASLLAVLMLASAFFMWSSWAPAYLIFGEMFSAAVLGKTFGLYNTICFLGAIAGPLVTGVLKDATGSFAGALLAAAVLTVGSAMTAAAVGGGFGLAAPCRSQPRIG
jgi:MFS family permease